MPLPEGSTVVTVANLLADGDEYVRMALGNFRMEYQKNPNAILTIGLMGDGKYPNYRIDQPLDGVDIEGGFSISIDMPELVFSGRNHKKLVDPSAIKFHNWSKSSIKFPELKKFYDEMPKLKKSKARSA